MFDSSARKQWAILLLLVLACMAPAFGQVAGRAAIQHETGIGDRRLMLGRGFDVLR